MENTKFEIRTASLAAEQESRTLSGYVVQWNKPSEVLWGEFIETFAPNAFTKSLNGGGDVRALFEHDYTKLLGRTSSNTLTLAEDNQGLCFRIDLPNTQLGNDILESVRRGDISGMSFGFLPEVEEWDETKEPALRTIKQAQLFEITVTSIPAYPDSSLEIAKRSRIAAKREQKNINQDEMRKNWLTLAEA
ncbi:MULTISPECIES: HK97 family phage prohead protease [Actinobacillus]|uniref:HK97 family phage prohead protease n=1 Tax=Actinobacillus TaxID=713 RepID=UPI000F6CAF2D|nr:MULTISPECIES: HK97 family phage prohead protease [Actinobacillus]MCY6395265.1 HK97 family phage prohead protease [Actinobacillus pleuropneumoniae]MCY6409065.1 HK97 family phage prohead protease [Actinobacillus pleuropneumoniae]MCY6429099.1 HK97 family phage prohead protease [Actinobacillus pleuropneumoniae]VEB25928.1 prohead protease (GP4) [Actinobacillus lignieresii]